MCWKEKTELKRYKYIYEKNYQDRIYDTFKVEIQGEII